MNWETEPSDVQWLSLKYWGQAEAFAWDEG